MDTPETKTFSLTLSSQTMLKALLLVIPIVGSIGYAAVTFYNKMNDTADAMEKIDLSPINEKIATLEVQVKAQNERIMAIADSNIRTSEKISDAIVLSRETSATVSGLRKELTATVDAMDEKLNTIKHATVNPLAK